MQKKIYLIGPITGVSYENAQGWRTRLSSRLLPDIKCIQPMFAERELLSQSTDPIPSHNPGELMSDAHALLVKDRFYCRSADIVYARFLGATAISRMSIGEVFWADAFGKPIILGLERSGNPNDDARIRAMTPWVVDNDEDAEEVIRGLLEAI